MVVSSALTVPIFLCVSVAEEEVKTESDAVEGMEISTRSKGETLLCSCFVQQYMMYVINPI